MAQWVPKEHYINSIYGNGTYDGGGWKVTYSNGESEIFYNKDEAQKAYDLEGKKITEEYWESDEYQQWKKENPEEAAKLEAEEQEKWKSQGLIEGENTPQEEPKEFDDESDEEETPTDNQTDDAQQNDSQDSTKDDGESSENTSESHPLVPPLNYTDPVVYHDPTIQAPAIVTKYQPSDAEGNGNEEGDIAGAREDVEINRIEGRDFPLVLLNTTVLQAQQIQKLVIYYDSFFPTLYLKVRDDQDGTIKFSNSPGINNHIRVIIVPEVEGTYKNISLEFYIDNCDFTRGDSYTFTGHLWVQSFEEKRNCQIKYPGCPNVKKKQGANDEVADEQINCNPAPQIKPNTWEYLHEISRASGLGFATTDKCKDIEDRLPRLMQHENFKEFIDRQIKISGLDEDSIFDVWIDFYRYITMVNVSWVLTEDIDVNHLAINAVVGNDGQAKMTPKAKFRLVHRTLTCSNKNDGLANMEYDQDNFTQISDNDIHTFGMFVNNPIYQAKGGTQDTNSEKNDMVVKDIQAQENSVDGSKISDYNTNTEQQVTILVDPYNTNNQKIIRQKFFELKRSKSYKLVLNRLNLGLQRGTLVNIHKSTTNPAQKAKVLTDGTNVAPGHEDNPTQDETLNKGKLNDFETMRDLSIEESAEVLDVALSGLYYIDAMTFEYDPSHEKLVQNLFLIKKGPQSSYNSLYNSTRLKPEEYGVLDNPPVSSPSETPASELGIPVVSFSHEVQTGGLSRQLYNKYF